MSGGAWWCVVMRGATDCGVAKWSRDQNGILWTMRCVFVNNE